MSFQVLSLRGFQYKIQYMQVKFLPQFCNGLQTILKTPLHLLSSLPGPPFIYVAYSLKSVVGLLYELLLSCFIPVVNALPKLQESGMFYFFKPVNFLSIIYCRCNVFNSVGGLGLLHLTLQFELIYVEKVNECGQHAE